VSLPEACTPFRKVQSVEEKTSPVLTIGELSLYLKIPKSTLYKLVRERKIPSQKIGRHWRFRKGAIDQWLGEAHIDESEPRGAR